MGLRLSAEFRGSRCYVAWGVNRKGRLKLLCSETFNFWVTRGKPTREPRHSLQSVPHDRTSRRRVTERSSGCDPRPRVQLPDLVHALRVLDRDQPGSGESWSSVESTVIGSLQPGPPSSFTGPFR